MMTSYPRMVHLIEMFSLKVESRLKFTRYWAMTYSMIVH